MAFGGKLARPAACSMPKSAVAKTKPILGLGPTEKRPERMDQPNQLAAMRSASRGPPVVVTVNRGATARRTQAMIATGPLEIVIYCTISK